MSEIKNIFDKAEQKIREKENNKKSELFEKLTKANIDLKELQEFTDKMGLGVHKKRKKSNIKHVQIIQENLIWLNNQKNNKLKLTAAEKAFLFDLSQYVKFGSNAVCKKNRTGEYIPCNITELAKMMNKTRQSCSSIINKLIKKGILAECWTGIDAENPKNLEENHPGKAKTLLVNPRIMHSGYNNEINETLKDIFKRSLTKVPIKMF